MLDLSSKREKETEAGVTRNLDETTSIGKVQFRCVQTFGDGLKSKGAGWIIVSPAGMRANLF